MWKLMFIFFCGGSIAFSFASGFRWGSKISRTGRRNLGRYHTRWTTRDSCGKPVDDHMPVIVHCGVQRGNPLFNSGRFLADVDQDDEYSDISTCPLNEIYSNCSNALCRALICEHRGMSVACPSVISCEKSCVCAGGFLRNTKGVCVPENQCDVGPKCPENQILSDCTNSLCRHQECYERGQPVVCPTLATGSCHTGCVCDVGYLRNTNGNCVKQEECDSIATNAN